MQRTLGIGLAAVLAASSAHAQEVKLLVTVESLTPANGAALSPFTFGFHNGSFDAFNPGSAASPGVENVAELGDGAAYIGELKAAHPAAVGGMLIATENAFGPGIFLPGGSGSFEFTLDSSLHRFMSFGSMVVPSNDRFVGNAAPIELFDAGGNFVGQTLTLLGANIWDSGTEVDAHFGAAFIVGQDAMLGTPQGGVIALDNDFGVYAGAATPAGYTFSALPADGDGVAQITFTVVPAPGAAALLGLGAMAPRRRRAV
jgi:hypothetical protein